MLRVTLSTPEGATITTDQVADAAEFAWHHQTTDRGPSWIRWFANDLETGHWKRAGARAEMIGLDFAVATAPREIYFVPVDPADETNCEGCQ